MVWLLQISCSDENQDGRSKRQQQTFPAKSGKQKHQQARQNFQQSQQKSAGGFEFSSTYKSVTRGVGDSDSPCADRWCIDSCSLEAKHTDTIFNVVRQNRLHPREKSILLESDRERITTHMEEEDHFTQTLLPLLLHCCTRQQGCCP